MLGETLVRVDEREELVINSVQSFPYKEIFFEFLDAFEQDFEIISIEPYQYMQYTDYFCKVLIGDYLCSFSYHIVDLGEHDEVLVLVADYRYNVKTDELYVFTQENRLLNYYEIEED